MADDWRVRVELADESVRRDFAGLLADGLSPEGADRAQALQGEHLSVSGDGANLFVYADSPARAEYAHDVILSELEHHAITATMSGVEHWLAEEERWDNEPAGETWEEEVSGKGYAPWEVRVTCRSRHEAVELAGQLEKEGYHPIRQWKHLIVGAATREDADALAARLHGEVDPGGAVVWEEAIDSHLVRPFAFFG
ncbi:MAG: SPOR domain-containing protein [Thermoleophilia bacterium]|nr:SPOR domain-containing protein [Thermoleophilia bacterium]